jgi:predicted transcriptional regulator
MSNVTISDTGIAVMCDIARASGLDLDDDKQAVLDRLIADGLVAKSSAAKPAEAAKFEVTPKGQRMLDERGVGVNES